MEPLGELLRRHGNLGPRIGSTVHTASLYATSASMIAILQFAKKADKSHMMPPWWLSLFAVENITKKICSVIKRMQGKVVASHEQIGMLKDLVADLELATQSQDTVAGIVGYCSEIIQLFVCSRDVNAYFAYEAADADLRHKLELAVSNAVEIFVRGIGAIMAEIDTSKRPLQTSFELVTAPLASLMASLNHHRASIIQYGGHAMIKAVATERQSLVDKYRANSSFAASVNCLKDAQLKDAWCHLSSVFPNLALFAA